MVNPVDLGPEASPATYQRVTAMLLNHPEVDMVLVLCVPTAFSDIKAISKAVTEAHEKKPKKPLITCWLAGDIVEAGLPILSQSGIPNFPTPYRAATALSILRQRAEWLQGR
jgi:acyl-CoA synthetase (NDP forming)